MGWLASLITAIQLSLSLVRRWWPVASGDVRRDEKKKKQKKKKKEEEQEVRILHVGEKEKLDGSGET